MSRTSMFLVASMLFTLTIGVPSLSLGNAADSVDLYQVLEISFEGRKYAAKDNPVRDVELITTWRHQDGKTFRIYGFWDGDGKGGASGRVFKTRFCPTIPGSWTLVKTLSNDPLLDRQKHGFSFICKASAYRGFWIPDPLSAGKRWFQRSDGTHQYIAGNTMYSFLSEYETGKPTGGNISDDVNNNSVYFNKLRFGLTGDRYIHPTEKPFLDAEGRPTDDGNFSFRPNAAWFNKRVDLAVRLAFAKDMIADLILNGPDVPQSRSALQSSANQGDCTPYLKYIAARYGSYPNVWLCLGNEYDIREPKYQHEQIIGFGKAIRQYLPYATPLSIHADAGDWYDQLNTSPAWNDHIIIQAKLKTMNMAADMFARNYLIGGGNKPIVNDELAYEGEGDGWTMDDVMEAFLGAFLGGGYASTGYKSGDSKGHYFTGKFVATEHKAAKNLKWMRKIIDENISFWKMKPVMQSYPDIDAYIFRKTQPDFRAMAWEGNEYLLGTNSSSYGTVVTARLPAGKWLIKSYDLIGLKDTTLAEGASGNFTFKTLDSRAAFVHFKKIPD